MDGKTYIVEIPDVIGDESSIYLEADGEPVKSLFCIVSISEDGASIIDNGYRSIKEAKLAWPEAVPPKPYNLTPSAIDKNFTIHPQANKRLN